MKQSILIVEDCIQQAKRCHHLLSSSYQVMTSHNLNDAKSLLDSYHFTTIITDIHLEEGEKPDFGGFEVLRYAQVSNPNANLIVLSSDPNIESFKEL